MDPTVSGPVLDAIVFDCDGVLVDSEPLHDLATRLEVESRGLVVEEEFFAQHIGMRVIDQMRALATEFDLDASQLYEAREARFWALVRERLEAIPGSRDAMVDLHRRGFRIGIATSGTRPWISHVVDFLGVGDVVSAVICGDDVTEPKPHPESYLRAAAALGVDPVRCGVVEDSRRGLQSASAAGCTVVVLDRHGVHAGGADAAHAVVDTMAAAAEALGALSSRENRPT